MAGYWYCQSLGAATAGPTTVSANSCLRRLGCTRYRHRSKFGVQWGWAKCFWLLRQITTEIFSERLPGWCNYRKRNEKHTICGPHNRSTSVPNIHGRFCYPHPPPPKLRLWYKTQWIFVQSGIGAAFKICGASVNFAVDQRSDSGTAPHTPAF